MKRPTQEEWDTMFECVQAQLEHLREHEPHAKNTIRLLEEIDMELPPDVEEAFSE